MGIVVSVLAAVGVLLPWGRALVQHCWEETGCETQGWSLPPAFLSSRHPLAQCKTRLAFLCHQAGEGIWSYSYSFAM